jgi:hypothetical protein
MQFLEFRGCRNKGFEIWYAPDKGDTPYEVREVTLLDERMIASFSVYDDAMDFIKVNAGETDEVHG